MASQNDREMKIVILLLAAALLILGAVAVAAASDRTDRMPVAVFDLRRYMGTWYEIARYDHSFERRLAGVQAHYELLSDGRVTVENSGVDYRSDRRKRARGKARATAMPGRLRVSFFWFFYSDYNVLELGPDYDWALVGGGSSKYLWILSRTPRLLSRTLNHILRLAEARGYRTGKLLFVDQGQGISPPLP